MYESYEDIMIGIEYNGQLVADAPYKLEGTIFLDDNFFHTPSAVWLMLEYFYGFFLWLVTF